MSFFFCTSSTSAAQCTVSCRGLPSRITRTKEPGRGWGGCVWGGGYDILWSVDIQRRKRKNCSQLPSLCASVWEHFHTVFTLMRNWNRLGGGTWPSGGSEQSACVSKQTHKSHSSEQHIDSGTGSRFPLSFPTLRLSFSGNTFLAIASRRPSGIAPHQLLVRSSHVWTVAVWDHQLAARGLSICSSPPTSHPCPSVRLCIPCVLPDGDLKGPSSYWEHGKTCGWTFIPFDHVCCFSDVGMKWCNVGGPNEDDQL